MVHNAGVERKKSSCTSISKKSTISKSSIRSKTANDAHSAGNRKCSPVGKDTKGRPKTADDTDTRAHKTRKQSLSDNAPNLRLVTHKEKSETILRKSTTEQSGQEDGLRKKGSSATVGKQVSETQKGTLDGQKKTLVYQRPSETFLKLFKEGSSGRNAKPKQKSLSERPSEIPKLKKQVKKHEKYLQKGRTHSSATVHEKDLDLKAVKLPSNTAQAAKENFTSLVPLYERELKKITDTWVNTIYCSLTMRTNLVKLLYDMMPSIDRSQFHMENETILQCISRAKNYTRSEVDNLIRFIKLLITNRNKAKEDYIEMLANKEIAESYNYDWRALTKRILDLGEETKQLQTEVPEIIKKRDAFAAMTSEKIKKMEANIAQKEEEIAKLENQMFLLQQREISYKGNVSLKIEEYKDIKEEVHSLKNLEKEFEDLKTKYNDQNEAFEKKIKDLETLLDERKKILKKEKEMKQQLQLILSQLHTQQQHLYRTVGKEQVDFILGRKCQTKNKRKEQLWLSAIKLVVRGFLLQTKKLERDKNKMLLELNSNDVENYNSIVTSIMQKDHFIRSIRHQMSTFNSVSKCLPKSSDTSITEGLGCS